MSDYTDRGLIPLQNSVQLLETYREAKRKAEAGIALLRESKKLMTAFGEHVSIIPDHFSDFNLGNPSNFHGVDNLLSSMDTLFRRGFWAYIADKTELRKIMSVKRRDELDKQLFYEPCSLPEPTEKSVFDFLNGNLGRAKEFAEEAVMEVFNFLRPRKSAHKFKTNDEFEIGPKVLRDYVMDTQYTVRIAFSQEKSLYAMDNLFRLLDGKPVPKYPDDIVTVINTACQNKQSSAETEYARFQWYKKGSLHIEFKRLDLVAKLNEIAGRALLKGE